MEDALEREDKRQYNKVNLMNYKKKLRLQLDPPLYLIYKNNNIFPLLVGIGSEYKTRKKKNSIKIAKTFG